MTWCRHQLWIGFRGSTMRICYRADLSQFRKSIWEISLLWMKNWPSMWLKKRGRELRLHRWELFLLSRSTQVCLWPKTSIWMIKTYKVRCPERVAPRSLWKTLRTVFIQSVKRRTRHRVRSRSPWSRQASWRCATKAPHPTKHHTITLYWLQRLEARHRWIPPKDKLSAWRRTSAR